MYKKPFQFRTLKESWDYFTKASRIHFAKLIRSLAKSRPKLRQEIKSLKYHDYCARLMYILNMWAHEGDRGSEFDLDWAMLMAKPMSADQARQSLNDLIRLGLMGRNNKHGNTQKDTPGTLDFFNDEENHRTNEKGEPGGNTGPSTRFDFDEPEV